MLVLSRRKSESIRIGDEIRIKLIDVRGKTVRIGIEAPDHVSILRAELVPGSVEVSPPCELVASEPVPAVGGA